VDIGCIEFAILSIKKITQIKKLHPMTPTIQHLTSTHHQLWDNFVRSHPEGCFMQSWAWADFKEREGYQTFRYGLFCDRVLVGGFIIYFYPTPDRANLLLTPGGPIFLIEWEEMGINLLLETASELANRLGAIALRIEPMRTQTLPNMSQFVRAPVDCLPNETLLVNLRQSEAEMLASMKPKGRYNLRLSQRNGVTTHFTNDLQAIPQFYDLFWTTVKHQQFFGEPYGFFINLCQTLFAAQMAEIGFATWQDTLLSTLLVVYWGNRATYLYGGRSFEQSNLMASYQLHWETMQRAKARGCQIYDFYGYSLDPNHAYAKFSQFKSKFGGVSVQTIGAHDYFFYDRLADTLIGLLQKISL
jgi:peptidoglycan pentaglycine glycine transferase (the first glycine)